MAISLARLIRQRMQELTIGWADLAHRMGYANIEKSCRRIAQICGGDLEMAANLRVELSRGLGVGVAEIDDSIEVTRAEQIMAEDKAYRASFRPHAVILTKRQVPSQITSYTISGGVRHRIISFKYGSDPRTYATQAREALPDAVPFFGASTGYVVNYSPDFALRFNKEGRMLERLDRAVRVGKSTVVVGGREVGEETLSASHGEAPPPKLLQQQIWVE